MEPQDRCTHNANGPSEAELSLAGRIYSLKSWAQTEDRSARTAPARAARDQRFLDEAGGDPVKADILRRKFFAEIALKSAQVRRANRDRRNGGAA